MSCNGLFTDVFAFFYHLILFHSFIMYKQGRLTAYKYAEKQQANVLTMTRKDDTEFLIVLYGPKRCHEKYLGTQMGFNEEFKEGTSKGRKVYAMDLPEEYEQPEQVTCIDGGTGKEKEIYERKIELTDSEKIQVIITATNAAVQLQDKTGTLQDRIDNIVITMVKSALKLDKLDRIAV